MFWTPFMTKNFLCTSYLILAPAQMAAEKDLKKAAEVCLDVTKLDPEMYRLGHTKARKLFH